MARVSADATFRLASNTKTFTAAAVLRLVEQGKVELDGPLTQCLDPELTRIVAADGYDTEAITVRQALSHTAGFFDFAQEPGYLDAVFADPTHHWSPAEQVQWAADHGDPLGAPGPASRTRTPDTCCSVRCSSVRARCRWHRRTESSFDFDDLGLDATYLESLELVPPTAGPRAHQFFGDVDTFAFDPSMNLYGDGGLVSSAADLGHFARALLGGEVFDDDATLDTMLAPATEPISPAMGIFREEINGLTCWSHQGLWGTAFFTCPDADLTISASVQQGSLDDVDLNPILFAGLRARRKMTNLRELARQRRTSECRPCRPW